MLPREAAGRLAECLRRDASSRVLAVAYMNMMAATLPQFQQSLYLMQYGARASIVSVYLGFGVGIDVVSSVLATWLLFSSTTKQTPRIFVAGVVMLMVSSLGMLFPPRFSDDASRQEQLLSHFFGVASICVAVGVKFMAFPRLLANLYVLPDTAMRAKARGYSTVVENMVGRGLTGLISLSLLARPLAWIKCAQAGLVLFGGVVSLLCGRAIWWCPRPAGGLAAAPAQAGGGELLELQLRDLHKEALERPAAPGGVLRGLREAAGSRHVWWLVLVQFFGRFIITLNLLSAASPIYWSSVVGVGDALRSVLMAGESFVGAIVVGLSATFCMTHFYRAQWRVQVLVPRMVFVVVATATVTLALVGTTELGALLGISALYAYFFTDFWAEITFLQVLDALVGTQAGESRADHADRRALLYTLFRDIVFTLLEDLRTFAVMQLLWSTGFHEPDCDSQCRGVGQACVEKCHAEAREGVGTATVVAVRLLFTVVTPAAYALSCALIAGFPALPSTRRQGS